MFTALQRKCSAITWICCWKHDKLRSMKKLLTGFLWLWAEERDSIVNNRAVMGCPFSRMVWKRPMIFHTLKRIDNTISNKAYLTHQVSSQKQKRMNTHTWYQFKYHAAVNQYTPSGGLKKLKNESLGTCLVTVRTVPLPLCFCFFLMVFTVTFLPLTQSILHLKINKRET